MKAELKMEKRVVGAALAIIAGAAAALCILWLVAWAVGSKSLPDTYLTGYAGAALFLGAMVSGACTPAAGGKRFQNGLIVGSALAVILILCKLLAEQEDVFGIQTWISVILCLAGGVSGSCIFHKRLQRNTRSKRRTRKKK